MEDLTPADWDILTELCHGTLTRGAAVGVCWPLLAREKLVQPNFGDITELGRRAVENRYLPVDDSPCDDWSKVPLRHGSI